MSTVIVTNLTSGRLSFGRVNLDVGASVVVDNLDQTIINAQSLGLVSVSPSIASMSIALIADNTGGVAVGNASFTGTISTTTLTVSGSIKSLSYVQNAAFANNLVNVPVTFTGGTVATGGSQGSALLSTNGTGVITNLSLVNGGVGYTVAPTGITGTGIGSGSFTSITPVLGITSGTVAVGQVLTGVGVAAGVYITALGTGTGGLGTYTISATSTVASTIAMQAAPGVSVITAPSANATTSLTADMQSVRAALSTLLNQYNALKLVVDDNNSTIATLEARLDRTQGAYYN